MRFIRAGEEVEAWAPLTLGATANETSFRQLATDFFASRLATAALAALIVIVALALLAPWIAPQNPYDLAGIHIIESRLSPGAKSVHGYIHWLGTDGAGRDLLSAILYGLRISLAVGVVSCGIAAAIGAAVGLTATYAGGRVDSILAGIIDLQLSFPAVLIALMLIATLGKGVDKIIVALVTVQWAYYARVVRGAALAEVNKGYVEAARCLGISHARILVNHILPSCLPPLIVVAALQAAHAIILEATLSFLGVGLPRTEPSLGLLIANGFDYMMSGKYWISFFPGLALLATIMAINLVGDRIRDLLNPRLER